MLSIYPPTIYPVQGFREFAACFRNLKAQGRGTDTQSKMPVHCSYTNLFN